MSIASFAGSPLFGGARGEPGNEARVSELHTSESNGKVSRIYQCIYVSFVVRHTSIARIRAQHTEVQQT